MIASNQLDESMSNKETVWLAAWLDHPGLDIHRLSGCGHYCMIEAPELVAQKLTALIVRSNRYGDQPAQIPAANCLNCGT